ncbi:MAG: hypothetical protein E7077_02540 [Bacteroidales bacterium]|jgi:hypothetical protein|nr:hypothetical protein [Bacteroidales bacterium]
MASKKIVAFILCNLIIFSSYGRDDSIIPVIQQELFKDETFADFTSITGNIYMWFPPTYVRFHYRGFLGNLSKQNEYIRDRLGCDKIDTISVQNSKYRLKYRKTSRPKKWNEMCDDYDLDKKSIILIKIRDIYQCSDSISYCMIQVYVIGRCYEYEFFLKKEGDKWIVIDKNLISGFLI